MKSLKNLLKNFDGEETDMIARFSMRMHILAAVLSVAVMATVSPSGAHAAEHVLAFAVSGVVAEVKVKVGDAVEAGQALVVLDARPFEARKRAADAAQKATRIVLDVANLRLKQVQELFDALSTSAEQVELAKIAQAQAMQAHEAAKAEAELAAWAQERATLSAPFGATVSAVPGYEGQVVELGVEVTPVVTLNRP
jgi:multidrug resistance efflux pump